MLSEENASVEADEILIGCPMLALLTLKNNLIRVL